MNGSSMSGVAVGVEASEDMKAESSLGGGEPVILNIYDMFWTNEYTGEEDAVLVLGILKLNFHSSFPCTIASYLKRNMVYRVSNIYRYTS